MSYQLVSSYFGSAVKYLNSVLALPVKVLQNTLSLKTESLPNLLQAPLAFASALMMMLFVILAYANTFICNLVGIVYPLSYGFNLLKQEPSRLTASTSLETFNKYWMVFGVYSLVESSVGFMLDVVPGYRYLKLAALYALVRNDFAMSNQVYGMLESYYENSNLIPKVQALLVLLMNKFIKGKRVEQNSGTVNVNVNVDVDVDVDVDVPVPEIDPLGANN